MHSKIIISFGRRRWIFRSPPCRRGLFCPLSASVFNRATVGEATAEGQAFTNYRLMRGARPAANPYDHRRGCVNRYEINFTPSEHVGAAQIDRTSFSRSPKPPLRKVMKPSSRNRIQDAHPACTRTVTPTVMNTWDDYDENGSGWYLDRLLSPGYLPTAVTVSQV